ncbi:MOSC domain-containing protein [Psychrobacter sp. I-STPA6b]|uniref:MOSC domain-containing protein n=1 Tax=Psychrobacter sp. I-STPA6b TaxID=2585718 RepID=UPI001D0CB410|nr:MOSC N-terminal beta barrel domain-containing protein [Psychrobacter sp. I-STPA6b]
MIATLHGIYHYPVKSLGGNRIQQAQICSEGMVNDRRWLITDLNGKFLTARRYPRMLLWQASMDTQHNLTLTAPNGDSQSISVQACRQNFEVTVWKDTFIAYTASDEVNQWLSKHLDTPCLLHYLGEKSHRLLKDYNTALSFADSAPYLLTTTASLNALNQHLESPVSMTHFRPNLVIDGDFEPWIEQQWRDIRIGEVHFEFLKCCTRCVMINIDPKTGEKSVTHQPFKTLQHLQRQLVDSNGDTIFGIHLIAKHGGTIRQGSRVDVSKGH